MAETTVSPIKPAAEARPDKIARAARAVAPKAVARIAAALGAPPETPEPTALLDTVQSASTPTHEKGSTDMATAFTPNFTAPEKLQTLFADAQSRAKDGMAKSAKLVEEMSDFTKGNVEAVMASGRIAAKGAETFGQDAASYGKKSFEDAAAAIKGMVAAKSPTELLKLQSDYARSSFDAAVAEGTRMSEAWLKLFGEIAQPLSTRVALAAEKIKMPLAN